jgi:carbon-monoxide dehydrogenase small subunit
MLLTAAELVRRPALPSRDEIRAALAGNYCRCTGYHAVIDAVEAAYRGQAAP